MSNFFIKNKIVGQTILVMLMFGLIFSAVLSIFYEKANPIILESEAAAKEKLLLQVITKGTYDNDLNKDFVEIQLIFLDFHSHIATILHFTFKLHSVFNSAIGKISFSDSKR